MNGAEKILGVPLQIAFAPIIVGEGVVFTITAMVEVLLQIPLEVITVTDPAGPAPQTTEIDEAVEEPLIVPPVTVHAYVVATGAEYENVPPLQTLFEPVIVEVGEVVTVTFKAELVTLHPVAIIVSLTPTVFAPAVFHKTVIALVPCPDIIVPPEETVHAKFLPGFDAVEYPIVVPVQTALAPVTTGVGNAFTFTE